MYKLTFALLPLTVMLACGEKTSDTSEAITPEEPAAEPAAQPSEEPAAEPAAQPTSEPTSEPTEAESFCTTYTDTCGTWTADTACEEWYNTATVGAEGDTSGASQTCYEYHLDVATQQTEQAMIDMHCAHSIGMADVDGNAPCTDAPDTSVRLHLDTSCFDPDGDGTVNEVTSVQMTGTWWSWATEGEDLPMGVDEDGDGIYTVTFDSLTENMDYKWLINGEFEADLTGAGFCADMTNPSNGFANRIWYPTDGDTTEYPGTCLECGQTDWAAQAPFTITLQTNGATSANIRGPWWDWGLTSGPVGDDADGDGTFTFTFDEPPAENMEFIFHIDGDPGTSEALVGQEGMTCHAINTDYSSYFNRYWLVGSGDQCYNFNSCAPCE
jgi:hypothetical protein